MKRIHALKFLSTSEKPNHASGHHELTPWVWRGIWGWAGKLGQGQRVTSTFPFAAPQLSGLGCTSLLMMVREHAWEREKPMMASGSQIHTPAVVVQHETFEGPHKRFLSHEILLLIIII